MKEAGRYLWDVRTPMRDGVELSTDLHFPPDGLAGGPYPVVLERTPSGNHEPLLVARARRLSEDGFVVALQDARGREDSDGTFAPFRDEGRDGFDTIEWLATQPWSNGRIGMMGADYSGWALWAAAREAPPHLVALAATSAWGAFRTVHANGLTALGMYAWLHAMSARVWQEGGHVDWERVFAQPVRAMDRTLGRDMPLWHEWLDHPTLDSYWETLEFSATDFASIDLPALHLTGWHEAAQATALHFYEGMRAHSPAAARQAAVLGPSEDDEALHARWFSRWLKEDGDDFPTRYFLTGRDDWRDAAWAAQEPTTAYFLSAGGAITTDAPANDSADPVAYDPADPVVITPDLTFFPKAPARRASLPLDRRFVERRPDVVVYTSPERTEPVELVGRPSVVLFVGSTAPDADWFIQLSDVGPSGASHVIATGGAHTSHAPDSVSEITLELTAIAHVVEPGHRLRVSVANSYFPLYAVNPNAATNHIHHGVAYPSRLVVPEAGQ